MTLEEIWKVLATVEDPEIPVISIVDLGIVREVVLTDDEATVVITPTYSGCPAMPVIEREIRQRLVAAGLKSVQLKTTLSPPWSSDWLSDSARERLRTYGISPPSSRAENALIQLPSSISCPRCGARQSKVISEFGSTACKALLVCSSCREPFEHFKEI